MEHGGLFEYRAQFWRIIEAYLPADHSDKDEL